MYFPDGVTGCRLVALRTGSIEVNAVVIHHVIVFAVHILSVDDLALDSLPVNVLRLLIADILPLTLLGLTLLVDLVSLLQAFVSLLVGSRAYGSAYSRSTGHSHQLAYVASAPAATDASEQ